MQQQQQQRVPAGVAVFWLSNGLQPEPAEGEARLPYHLLPRQLAPTSEPVASNHADTNNNGSNNEESIDSRPHNGTNGNDVHRDLLVTVALLLDVEPTLCLSLMAVTIDIPQVLLLHHDTQGSVMMWCLDCI